MHVFRWLSRTLFIAALITVAVVPKGFARGQALDGVIEGVVEIQVDGRPLAGATVRAFNAGTGYERSVVSDDSGRYNLPLLPPGEYVVLVEAPSFATLSRTGIALRAGQTLTVEFAMSTSAFAETVQVTAGPSIQRTGCRSVTTITTTVNRRSRAA